MKFIDTILAQSTPIGNGGIGIIRISGNKSLILSKYILNKTPKNRYAHFCLFKNKYGITIDQGICIYYKSPNSFTGEDVLELQCHGGQKIIEIIIKNILNLKISNIRLALPGEFTKRAFLNNKIDLLQAESINNLIKANSEHQINILINILKGNYSKKINNILNIINDILIILEKEINFSENNIKNKYKLKIKNKIKYINNNINILYKKFNINYIYKQGIKIIIIGPPNVGKSSLMNKITNYKNSIVTDIPGTTRDIIKDFIYINNIKVEILDTAGIHKTKNIIEKIGIKKIFYELKTSKIIIYIENAKNNSFKNIIKNFNNLFKTKKYHIIIIIRNKIDLTNEKEKIYKIKNYFLINLSIKKSIGINLLFKLIKKKIKCLNNIEYDFHIQEKNIQFIKKTKCSIKKIKTYFLNKYLSWDIIKYEFYSIKKYLSKILGKKKFTSDKIINNVFNNFCIGK